MLHTARIKQNKHMVTLEQMDISQGPIWSQ